ncbi:hypothetical protein BpHYR1_033514 [Brachionus plicatilis]|uniref:Uncharacterized protein n=1 Tax=Brachionus plicatilis TaxID=10195 RepID=A0A3M7QWV3_BRAPC|nr:hypothetical protein BpHYR1_033514 [Brachionus plicatilis]
MREILKEETTIMANTLAKHIKHSQRIKNLMKFKKKFKILIGKILHIKYACFMMLGRLVRYGWYGSAGMVGRRYLTAVSDLPEQLRPDEVPVSECRFKFFDCKYLKEMTQS